jgi:dCTP deaminase
VLLSDRDIKAQVAAGRLGLDPYEPSLLQPSSIDVRLDRWFRVFNNQQYTHIDPAQQQVTLPDDLAGRLEGKSSLGRLGLLTHSTAGFIDPGFTGHITLELSNVATLPIILHPGMKIGQLCLFALSSPAEQPYGSSAYGSRYQNQRGPTPSRSWVNFQRWPTQ